MSGLSELRAEWEALARVQADVDAGYAHGVRDDDVDAAVQRVLGAVGRLLSRDLTRVERAVEATESMMRIGSRHGTSPAAVTAAVAAMLRNELGAG